MKNVMNIRQFAALSGLIAAVLVTGCAHSGAPAPKQINGTDFVSEDQPTSIGRFSQAQCSAGAKEDGTLFDHNFHGDALNSLGQGKLDLIVKGTPAGDPVLVFLSMTHDQVAARQAAVTAYLKTAGVQEDKIIVAEGSNTNLTTPTAYNLGTMYKQDGTSFTGQVAPDASGPAAPMGGGSH
jgi:hypothetical protein